MLYILRKVSFCFGVILLGVSFFLNKSVLAAFVVNDNFSSTDELSHYTVYLSRGSVSIENGMMNLSAPYGDSFPFVILTNSLPDNFSVEIKFKYPHIGSFGTGISFDETWPYSDPSIEDNRGKFLYYFWGDPSGLNLFKITHKNPIVQEELLSLDYSSFHIAKLIKNNNYYQFYVDDNLIDDEISNRDVNFISFGNTYHTNTSDWWSEISIDYVRVEDLDAPNEPSVPYLSQKDPLWGNVEYDTASQWAPSGHQGIANWGCALTSSAMIFQNLGIKSPSGETTTPLVLNNWLKSQPDGYVGNGLVNWLALTRYAKEARQAGHSPTSVEFTSEQYDRNQTYETPSIINLPGHFVVGYDQTDADFRINDPADETHTTLAKTSNIKRINRFIPSNTDLSYFMFTINPDVNVELLNDQNQPIGQIFDQEPLIDDVSGASSSGQTLRTLMVAKPLGGEFVLKVTNPNEDEREYHLRGYFYDENGQVHRISENKFLLSNHTDEYHFQYQRQGEIDEVKPTITIDSIKSILETYFNQGKVKSFYYRFVSKYLDKAKNENDLGKQKEIMDALERVTGNNFLLISSEGQRDVHDRILQWVQNH